MLCFIIKNNETQKLFWVEQGAWWSTRKRSWNSQERNLLLLSASITVTVIFYSWCQQFCPYNISVLMQSCSDMQCCAPADCSFTPPHCASLILLLSLSHIVSLGNPRRSQWHSQHGTTTGTKVGPSSLMVGLQIVLWDGNFYCKIVIILPSHRVKSKMRLYGKHIMVICGITYFKSSVAERISEEF